MTALPKLAFTCVISALLASTTFLLTPVGDSRPILAAFQADTIALASPGVAFAIIISRSVDTYPPWLAAAFNFILYFAVTRATLTWWYKRRDGKPHDN